MSFQDINTLAKIANLPHTEFVKILSNNCTLEEIKEIADKYKDEPLRAEQQLKWEQFVIPQGANFYDVFGQREASNISELINEDLEQIEKENSAKLGEVFRVDFNSEYNLGKIKERNRRLKMLLEDFNKPELDLSPDRVSVDIINRL